VTFKRTAAAAALVSTLGIGLNLGFAGPAQADPVIQGVYTYTQDGVAPQSFSIYPSCVPVVGDLREPLELAVACRLHVATSAGIKGGDAVLTNGMWTYSVPVKDGMQCPDGSTAPIRDVYKFDDVSLTGTRTVFHNADCGLQPGEQNVPFTLTYKEPLPLPVTLYPLNCEPGGLRRCS
jgi:hypothetical protein